MKTNHNKTKAHSRAALLRRSPFRKESFGSNQPVVVPKGEELRVKVRGALTFSELIKLMLDHDKMLAKEEREERKKNKLRKKKKTDKLKLQ